MLNHPPFRHHTQHGVSLLEVLITIVILAFGLLGLAGLQAKIQLVEVESFQRAQAILLLNDMSERISANRANAATYASTTTWGTGNSQPTDCTSQAVVKDRDTCEWSNALRGASEQQSGVSTVGAMKDGRGCITEVQAPNLATGVCTHGIYQITVVWQGLHQTAAPASAVTCGQGSYGTESYRRAISARIAIGLPTCI
ncbi:MAG: type IV pilus modification protein PilV [Gallionellaceae bacterium]|nr:type IV pilus modification protein PilV [Gallionellaceae bacterium]